MGRGRPYGWVRRWADTIQGPLYGSRWATGVAYSLGLQGRLHVDHRVFTFGEALGRTPLRAAFISDLHASPLTDSRLLEGAIRRIADAAPDLWIAHTRAHTQRVVAAIIRRQEPRL